MTPLTLYMLAALLLLAIGLLGLISRRTAVGMLISVELMLNGAGLSLVAAAKLTPAADAIGQLGAIFIMGVAAAEAAILLAMLVVARHRAGSVAVGDLASLKDAEI